MKRINTQEVVDRLVGDNINLAYKFAHKYEANHEYDECESAALYGLLKGARTFDESKGFKPTTYLAACIISELNMLARWHKRHKELVILDEPINDSGDFTAKSELLVSPLVLDEYVADKLDQVDEVVNAVRLFLAFNDQYKWIYALAAAGASQTYIASLVNLNQTAVSRILTTKMRAIAKSLDTRTPLSQQVIEQAVTEKNNLIRRAREAIKHAPTDRRCKNQQQLKEVI